jgi:adenylate cyclase
LRVLAASLAVLGRLDEAQQAASRVLLVHPEFRIAAWQERSALPGEPWQTMAQRLRLAGLPA